MSWTLYVPATPKSEFDAAVDAAVPSGQDGLPGVAEDVAAAKAVLKELALRVKRPLVTGNAGGHSLQEGEGLSMFDGVNASVSGSERE